MVDQVLFGETHTKNTLIKKFNKLYRIKEGKYNMVNVSGFKRTKKDFIKVETIQRLKTLEQKRVVIMPGAEFKEYAEKKNSSGVTMPPKTRLQLPVSCNFDSNEPKTEYLSLGEDSVQAIARDMASENTEDWVGGILQLEVAGYGAVPYIKPTVIHVAQQPNSVPLRN